MTGKYVQPARRQPAQGVLKNKASKSTHQYGVDCITGNKPPDGENNERHSQGNSK
jgi:hypothetical protein